MRLLIRGGLYSSATSIRRNTIVGLTLAWGGVRNDEIGDQGSHSEGHQFGDWQKLRGSAEGVAKVDANSRALLEINQRVASMPVSNP